MTKEEQSKKIERMNYILASIRESLQRIKENKEGAKNECGKTTKTK